MLKVAQKSGSTRTGKPRAQRQFISFFSGALGLDLGLETSGLLQCAAVNDVDPNACRTIFRNRPKLKLYARDIRSLTLKMLCNDLGIEPGELFAVVGGPPCQAFSTAGRRNGLNDERGNVFLHFISLIQALQPKYAIFENVRGLLSAPLSHRPHEQRGPGFPPLTEEEQPGGALLHILRLLEEAGYETTFTLYNTANFGVPQVRERLIFFASREGNKVPYMAPTHDKEGRAGLPPWRTLRDAIAHLQGKPQHAAKFPEDRIHYYKMLREGQNWRDLPEPVQRNAMGESWYAGGGKTGFYRRLAWDKPAPTLVTRPTMKATDLCHPEEIRPLSVEEYAAIQTFPPDYVFDGKLDDQYRQIGNAVPPKFGAAIGQHIIAFDEGTLAEEDAFANGKLSRYDGTDHHSWRESVAWMERQTLACK
jgi:DNA (cytosine-5)-methyltransferase 1